MTVGMRADLYEKNHNIVLIETFNFITNNLNVT